MNATIENPTDTSAQAPSIVDGPALESVEDTIEARWPIPNGDLTATYTAYNRTYRFCAHCHTPKPVAQIRSADAETFPNVCATCYNGMLNYDRLSRLGVIPGRPGFVAPTVKAKVAREPKAPKTPRLVKITLEDGSVVEGVPIKVPRTLKAVDSNGTEPGAETKKGKKGATQEVTSDPEQTQSEEPSA